MTENQRAEAGSGALLICFSTPHISWEYGVFISEPLTGHRLTQPQKRQSACRNTDKVYSETEQDSMFLEIALFTLVSLLDSSHMCALDCSTPSSGSVFF